MFRKYKWWWILGGGFLLIILSGFFFLFGLAVLILGAGPDSLDGSGDIAVVEIKGEILDSQKIVQQLDQIEHNDQIRSLLLRIDSPGGPVAPAQEIYQAVLRVRKKKPVVASLGTVGASGGYYIAVAANKIVANPGTITGSIGVIWGHTNIESLLKFLKIDAKLITAGELKDVGSFLRPLSEQDLAFMQALLDNMHDQFKRAVKEGRNFDDVKINEVAKGQVYTGEQALELGLIDYLGNQQVAVDLLKQQLKIDGKPSLLYPTKKNRNLLDLFVSGELHIPLRQLLLSLRQGRALYLAEELSL